MPQQWFACRRLDDGRIATVVPKADGSAELVASAPPGGPAAVDRWQYLTPAAAVDALAEWPPGDPEPAGWYQEDRHYQRAG